MSNSVRATLTLLNYFAGLAAFAWVVSTMRCCRFGAGLLGAFGAYAVILLAYACSRRVVQKIHIARARNPHEVNRRG